MKGFIKGKYMTRAAGLVLALVLAAPLLAGAEEGMHHAETWELRRDGAMIVNFSILLAGLLWVLFKFIIPGLKSRTEELAATMAQSENSRKEAEARLSELEQKMREFEVQSAKIRQDSVNQAEQMKAKIIGEATAVAARIIEKAKAEIDSEAGKAQNLLRKEAVELAASLAAELLSKNFNENDQRNSVKDYIKGVAVRGGSK